MVKKVFHENVRVSYIIPHLPKTRVEFLCEAIKSAENQTHGNIEIILIGKNQKGCLNINDGLKIATGDLIHFLHDDDFLNPESAEIAVREIGENDFLHGDVIKHYENGRQVRVRPEIETPTYYQLIKNNVIQVASVYYRKSALEKIGGYNTGGNELYTHLDLLAAGCKLGYVNQVLSYYRKHRGQFGQSESYINADKSIHRNKLKEYASKII